MISVTEEPKEIPSWWERERCCFCRERTRFWYVPKDVAVCDRCAKHADASDVPSKKEWLGFEESE